MKDSEKQYIHPTRIFKKPEELAQAFEEYKEELQNIEAKRWEKIQYVGRQGDRVTDPPKMPLTFEGFNIFCRKKYGNVEQYFKNQDGLYEDFIPICSHVKQEIRNDQITGGLLGAYNPSITQRLNSLVDHYEVTEKQKTLRAFPTIEELEGE